MLRSHPDDAVFEQLRAQEFARLDDQGRTYLDFAGSGLYGASQVAALTDALNSGLYGNPHAEHRSSRASMAMIDQAREAVADWFGVDQATHAICFAANTSAAIKLVAESYPFDLSRGLVLTADNHNSVNGIREFARRRSAPVSVLPIRSDDMRLDDPATRLAIAGRAHPGLFAFPAQSNFSGVRHPLDLIATAKAAGLDVLVDAAGLPPSAMRGLGRCGPDYMAVSFYKMFGLPTGLGVLIARREALARLERPWFAGGTVDFVSVQHDRHRLSDGHDGFEDGTPGFLNFLALPAGFALLEQIGAARLTARIARLGTAFREALSGLRHDNGEPVARLYGPDDDRDRGATFAFNLLDPHGAPIPYGPVESAMAAMGVDMRGGCFCNPGAAEAAFGFDKDATIRCLDTLEGSFSVPRFNACLGPGTAVGAVRASLGYPTNAGDIERAVLAIETVADDLTRNAQAHTARRKVPDRREVGISPE